MTYLFLIIGIALTIIKANTALIIANWIIYTCFGVAGALFLFQLINYFSIKRKINNIHKRW